MTTDDDYILTTFHVLGKKGSRQKTTEGSVLIQHGHTSDGTRMMETFEDRIPFHLLLVDAGYDVWIGNNRGTEYSWGHKTLSELDPLYWNFPGLRWVCTTTQPILQKLRVRMGVTRCSTLATPKVQCRCTTDLLTWKVHSLLTACTRSCRLPRAS